MSSPPNQTTLARRDFVRLSAGMIGGLGIVGGDGMDVVAGENQIAAPLDASYLEQGLIGMARSKGWFNAHLGAAVLAGYYMCKENPFDERLTASIKKQLDALVAAHEQQFTPFANLSADKSLIERVPKALAPAVDGGLRAHGHAVIYTALSVRALRDAPQMADPRLIDHLCGHNAAIAKKQPTLPKARAEYADSQAMVEALFDSLARFKPLVGRPSVRRPNFVHMTTHTEALMALEEMGYTELAKTGQLGHQAHIGEPVPDFDPAEHPLDEHHASLSEVMSESFWEDPKHQQQWSKPWGERNNPNGYWLAFGHLFKVLYSYHRLVKRMKDTEKVRVCSQVLLERCVNPNVQGG
ncbi:MAG: hypothetical protein KDB14_02835 [Planctomycetales bacterium]|nr:hypothetical protein [Planctomycetales bacterium]